MSAPTDKGFSPIKAIANFLRSLVGGRPAILMALFIALEGAISLPHALLKAGFRAGPLGDLSDLLVANVLGVGLFLGLRHVDRRFAGALPATRLRRIAARSLALLPLLLVLAACVVLLGRGWWRLSDLWLVIVTVNSLVLATLYGWLTRPASWPFRSALVVLAAASFYIYASLLHPLVSPFFLLAIQTGCLCLVPAKKLPRAFWLLGLVVLLAIHLSYPYDLSAFDRYRFDNLFWPWRLPDEMMVSSVRELFATLRQASWLGGSSVLPLPDAATQWALLSHLEQFGALSLGVVLASVFYWFFLVRPRWSLLAAGGRRSVFVCTLWLALLSICVVNVCASLALIQGFDSRVPLLVADLPLILAAWLLMAANPGDGGRRA